MRFRSEDRGEATVPFPRPSARTAGDPEDDVKVAGGPSDPYVYESTDPNASHDPLDLHESNEPQDSSDSHDPNAGTAPAPAATDEGDGATASADADTDPGGDGDGSTPADPAHPADLAEPGERQAVEETAGVPPLATGDGPDSASGAAAAPPTAGHLIDPADAQRLQERWHDVQSGFVDDPPEAVRKAEELTGEVLDALKETLDAHRRTLRDDWQQGDKEPDTERLRLALRGYRDLVDRVLSA